MKNINIVVSSKKETGVSGQQTLKRAYTAPAIDIVKPAGERVMLIVSPGVGSDYNGGEIEAPRHELDIEFRDVWEE